MANPKMTKQWFVYAIRDLKAAQALHGLSIDYKYAVAFHCQQCVEKAAKGYLTFNDVRVHKTHSLKVLAIDIAKFDKKLAAKFKKADTLTKHAVVYRYPDAMKKQLTAKQLDNAMKLAQELYDVALKAVR